MILPGLRRPTLLASTYFRFRSYHSNVDKKMYELVVKVKERKVDSLTWTESESELIYRTAHWTDRTSSTTKVADAFAKHFSIVHEGDLLLLNHLFSGKFNLQYNNFSLRPYEGRLSLKKNWDIYSIVVTNFEINYLNLDVNPTETLIESKPSRTLATSLQLDPPLSEIAELEYQLGNYNPKTKTRISEWTHEDRNASYDRSTYRKDSIGIAFYKAESFHELFTSKVTSTNIKNYMDRDFYSSTEFRLLRKEYEKHNGKFGTYQ